MAKLEVFSAAVDAQQYWLAIVGVIAAVIAAFFYLRVTVVMFSADPDAGPVDEAPARWSRIDVGTGFVLVAATVIVLLIGIVPGGFLHFARDAAFLI